MIFRPDDYHDLGCAAYGFGCGVERPERIEKSEDCNGNCVSG
jgi:hypothetical protein